MLVVKYVVDGEVVVLKKLTFYLGRYLSERTLDLQWPTCYGVDYESASFITSYKLS